MNLSPHFTLAECTRSRDHPDIPNIPPPEIIARMKATCREILEPARAHFNKPVIINSFYRGAALEKAICWGGDNENSAFAKWCVKRGKPVTDASWPLYFAAKSHPEGEAVDFEIPGVDNAIVAAWLRDNTKYDQVILEFYRRGDGSSGWVHASHKTAGCRAECLTINNQGTFKGLLA